MFNAELKARTQSPDQSRSCCRVRTPETRGSRGSIARAIIRDETALVAHIRPAFRTKQMEGIRATMDVSFVSSHYT